MMTGVKDGLRRCAAAGAALLALGPWASPAGAGADRPHRGNCSTVVTPISETQLRIAGECTLTHLGATRSDSLQTVVPMGPPVNGVLMLHIVNDTTYRAANGDLLAMTFSGHGHLELATGQVHFMGVESFVGGTGRFAAATGMSQVEGTASVVTHRGEFVTRGRIAY